MRRQAWFMIPIGYGRAETLLATPAAEPIPKQALLWGGFSCRIEEATQGSLHHLVLVSSCLSFVLRVLVLVSPCLSFVLRVLAPGPTTPLFTNGAHLLSSNGDNECLAALVRSCPSQLRYDRCGSGGDVVIMAVVGVAVVFVAVVVRPLLMRRSSMNLMTV